MQPLEPLNVSLFPDQAKYTCADETVVDFGEVLETLRPAIDLISMDGLFRESDDFGLAISRPYFEGDPADLTDFDTSPQNHIAFTGGWGPKRDQCVANAIRKMRPLYRCPGETASLDMRLFDETFEDIVASVEDDGSFLWGDFPFGGAVWVLVGDVMFCVAVSGLHQVDDHAAAHLYGCVAGKRLLIGDGLLKA